MVYFSIIMVVYFSITIYTITRDRKLREKGASFPYLDEMDAFFARIRKRLSSDDLQLEKPRLMPILKDTKEMGGGELLLLVARFVPIPVWKIKSSFR